MRMGKKLATRIVRHFSIQCQIELMKLFTPKTTALITVYILWYLVFSVMRIKYIFEKKIVFKLRTFLKDEIFGGGPVFWLFFF